MSGFKIFLPLRYVMHFNKEKATLNLMQVLQTIPWARVDIELVSVETDLAGRVMEGTRGDIIQYMGDQGYIHRSVGIVG